MTESRSNVKSPFPLARPSGLKATLRVLIPMQAATSWDGRLSIQSGSEDIEEASFVFSALDTSYAPIDFLGWCPVSKTELVEQKIPPFPIRLGSHGRFVIQAAVSIYCGDRKWRAETRLSDAVVVMASPDSKVKNVQIQAHKVIYAPVEMNESTSDSQAGDGRGLETDFELFIRAEHWTQDSQQTQRSKRVVIAGTSRFADSPFIKNCLEQTATGGQLVVLPGIYHGSFDVMKPVQITGATDKPSDVKIVQDFGVPINLSADATLQGMSLCKADNDRGPLIVTENDAVANLKNCEFLRSENDPNPVQSGEELERLILGPSLDEAFVSLTKRVVVLETRTTGHSNEIVQISNMLTKRVSDLEARATGHSNDIEQIDRQISNIREDIGLQRHSLSIQDSKITALQQGLAEHAAHITQLTRMVSGLVLTSLLLLGLGFWLHSLIKGIPLGQKGESALEEFNRVHHENLTIDQWMEKMRGPPGKPGDIGQRGFRGETGAPGADGRPGPQVHTFAIARGEVIAWVQLQGNRRRQRITPFTEPSSVEIDSVVIRALQRNGLSYIEIEGDYRKLEDRIAIYARAGISQGEDAFEPPSKEWIRIDSP